MADGTRQEANIPDIHLPGPGAKFGCTDQVIVGPGHQFRQTGGAAGRPHVGHLHGVRPPGRQGGHFCILQVGGFDKLFNAQMVCAPAGTHQNHIFQPGAVFANLVDDGQIIGLFVLSGQNPGGGLAQFGQVFDLVWPVTVDQQGVDGADLLKGEKHHRKFAPVGQLDQHTVRWPDAQAHQADGQPVGPVTGPGIGQAAVPVDKGHFVRKHIGRPVENIAEGQPRPPAQPIVLFNIIGAIGGESFDQIYHRAESSLWHCSGSGPFILTLKTWFSEPG